MDKRSKNQISILFNGKESTLNVDEEHEDDLNKNSEVQKNYEEPLSYDSLIQDEDDNYSNTNVIDFETLRHNKQRNSPRMFSKKKSRFNINKQPNGKSKMFLSILAAILTGTIFGLIVLTLFTNVNLFQMESKQLASSTPDESSIQSEQVVAPVSKTESLAIPSLSLFVIQAGAFSTKESAEDIAQNIKAQSLPAVIIGDSEPLLLFVGIGQNKQTLTQVGEIFKSKGQEIYVKSYNVEGRSIQTSDVENIKYMQLGGELFEKLITLSAKGLVTKSVTPEELENVKRTYETWIAQKPSNLEPSIVNFTNELTSVYEIISASPNQNQLFESQEILLSSLLIYEQWISSIK